MRKQVSSWILGSTTLRDTHCVCACGRGEDRAKHHCTCNSIYDEHLKSRSRYVWIPGLSVAGTTKSQNRTVPRYTFLVRGAPENLWDAVAEQRAEYQPKSPR